jgi:hypothetical protein
MVVNVTSVGNSMDERPRVTRKPAQCIRHDDDRDRDPVSFDEVEEFHALEAA